MRMSPEWSLKQNHSARGELIADALALAWQNPAPLLSLSSESLNTIAPLLLNSGAGALMWWRIQHSGLRSTPAAQELHQAYRLHTLQAGVKRLEISQVWSFLRSRGLEPLMGKGWVIAKEYPEPGLRPYGDIDLYLRPEEYTDFEEALGRPEARGWNVDLHRGAAELDDRSFDVLYRHSRVSRVGEMEVRSFGPEDHLRLLCLHFLRESALRPLWLCDIAVALNSLPPDFDWEYFLSGNAQRSDWAACTIGLACRLLGADVGGLPVEWRARHLPAWLTPGVLNQWGQGKVTKGRRTPMSIQMRRPLGVLGALRLRWPDPIEATVDLKGRFNDWPRLPYQVGACLVRTAGFARRLPRLLGESR